MIFSDDIISSLSAVVMQALSGTGAAIPIYLPYVYSPIWWISMLVLAFSFTLPIKAFLMRKYSPGYIWLNLLFVDISIIAMAATGYGLTLDAFSAKITVPLYWVILRILGPAFGVFGLFIFQYKLRHAFLKMFKVPRKWYHAL